MQYFLYNVLDIFSTALFNIFSVAPFNPPRTFNMFSTVPFNPLVEITH
jgi:hypothetical protein